MTGEIAFVGDVHGSLRPLRALSSELLKRDVAHLVFLGDYINKGRDSLAVLEFLLDLSLRHKVTALRGNHEEEFLQGFESGDLTAFLAAGGAAAVRSYVPGVVSADVAADLRSHVPDTHINFLRSMSARFEAPGLLALHAPTEEPRGRYVVSAHRPVGRLPRIGERSAQLDTGCGGVGGRLSALLWPSRRVVQADEQGRIIGGSQGVSSATSERTIP